MKNLLTIIAVVFLTLQMQAQCNPDKHNTTWYDGWLSCEPSENPHEPNGISHWIMYDFGQTQSIKGIHIWNSNVPGHLDNGIQKALIEYSANAEEWETLDTFVFEQATGKNNYTGFDLPDVENIEARYLLITALSNYGGNCYGLAEVKFDIDSTTMAVNNLPSADDFSVLVYPNPFRNKFILEIQSKPPVKKAVWFVTNTQGKRVTGKRTVHLSKSNQVAVDSKNWPSGVYFLTVQHEGKQKQIKLVKIN